MTYFWYNAFPVGALGIAQDDAGICAVFQHRHAVPKGAQEQETPLLRQAALQLEEYFTGVRQSFDLPVSLHGTPFQREVWEALRTIPYGQTRSYSEVAAQIGRPKAGRAVGLANNRNPLMILVPCHRVIGKNGTLTGYAGGLEMKAYLLELEHTYG